MFQNGCIPSTQITTTQITLNGPTVIQPLNTGKITTATITALVTSGGQPQPGISVKLSNTVEFTSGGHEANHISARPLGTINGSTQTVSLVSDASGTVKFKFTGPAAAGTHTIKAECDSCASPANHKIDVKVPGLVALTADTATPRQYTLVGNTAAPGLNHPSSHWFAPTSLKVLEKVIGIMNTTGWGAVGVNDGSLPWGGLFDIYGKWAPPSHQGHRDGTEVDISFTLPKSPTDALKKKTFDKLCEKENTTLDIQTLWHKDDGYKEHYHIYLDGTGLGSNAAGGNCCTSYKITRAKKNKDGTPVLDRSGKVVTEQVFLCEEVAPR